MWKVLLNQIMIIMICSQPAIAAEKWLRRGSLQFGWAANATAHAFTQWPMPCRPAFRHACEKLGAVSARQGSHETSGHCNWVLKAALNKVI